MSSPKKVSAPIRMSPELMEKVTEAANLTGMAQADIMRLAIQMGLEDLRRINYNIGKCVSDAAHDIRQNETNYTGLSMVAEDPTDYRITKAGNGGNSSDSSHA